MSTFATAVAALFRDRNMAVDAMHFPSGAGPGEPCRVIVGQPDAQADFGGARLVADSVSLQLLTSEVPELAAGDEVEVGPETFRIAGEPMRDALRLVWTAEARPV